MARSADRPAPTARSAGELLRELRRLVLAITDDDDATANTFEEAARVVAELREVKDVSGKRRDGEVGKVPEVFLCPISSEIMRDPVVVSSGQTYDRSFIQEWLNSGNLTCPQTRQVLSHTTLTPNHLVRSMISQWCSENGITLPLVQDHEGCVITRGDRDMLNKLLDNISGESNSGKKEAMRELRLLTKQSRSFRGLIGDTPHAIPLFLSVLTLPGLKDDKEVQEDTVTAILNLSIHDSNKKLLGEDPQVVPLLVEALRKGSMRTKSNAAAALFTLSALDSNKTRIGELGAMLPLHDLLEQGNLDAKKDAASAIFNLCMTIENRVRAVREGAVSILLKSIMDGSLVDESLAILAMLSSNRDAVEEAGEIGSVPVLLLVLKESSCSRSKENAAVILYSVCMNDRRKLREVGDEEDLSGIISQLAKTGTSRARRKASAILEKLRRTTQITHYSC